MLPAVVIAGALALEPVEVRAQRRPLITVEHVGENALGAQFAKAVQRAVDGFRPADPHVLRILTAPSPCSVPSVPGVVVSLTVVRGDGQFVSSAVMFVTPVDVERIAASIAKELARDMKWPSI